MTFLRPPALIDIHWPAAFVSAVHGWDEYRVPAAVQSVSPAAAWHLRDGELTLVDMRLPAAQPASGIRAASTVTTMASPESASTISDDSKYSLMISAKTTFFSGLSATSSIADSTSVSCSGSAVTVMLTSRPVSVLSLRPVLVVPMHATATWLG